MPNPKNHIDSEYSYVSGYVRRKRGNSQKKITLYSLPLAIIIGLSIWLVTTFWILIVIVAVIAFGIFTIVKWHKWSLTFYSLGVLGFVFCLIFFFIAKSPSGETVNAVQVNKLSVTNEIVSNQAIAQLSPNLQTKPDQMYLITVDNGVTKLDYYPSWSKLEIDIKEVKNLEVNISQDQSTAWNMYPKYKVSIYEMIPRHNFLDILTGIGIFALCWVLARYVFPRIFTYY